MKTPHSPTKAQTPSREEYRSQDSSPQDSSPQEPSSQETFREEGSDERALDRSRDRDIFDIYTRSAYLFVTDAFRIGKVRFLLGSNKEDTKVTAYASAEDLRPLVYDLFARGGLRSTSTGRSAGANSTEALADLVSQSRESYGSRTIPQGACRSRFRLKMGWER